MDQSSMNMSDSIPFAHVDLDDQRGLSGFGVVLQLMRLNNLMPRDLQSALGMRLRYSDDWSYRIATSAAVQHALLARIPRPDHTWNEWGILAWQPYSGTLYTGVSWDLRGCPECFRYGYHSNLFQMPWIMRCPWHGLWLTSNCARCQQPLGRGISRDTPILLCQCGGDAIDLDRLLEHRHPFRSRRNHFVARYLQWAQAGRKHCTLFGSNTYDPESLSALRRLIILPPAISFRAQGARPIESCVTHTQMVRIKPRQLPRVSAGAEKFRACIESFWTSDPTMVELPSPTTESMAAVTRSWVRRCPPGVLSRAEGNRLGMSADLANPSQHPRISLVLLPACSVGGRTFFDGRSLAREVYQLLSDLCGAHLTKRIDESTSSVDRELITRTLTLVMARGYSDALSKCLSRYVPTLLTSKKCSNSSWRPMALTRISVRKANARILWLRRAHGDES